MSKPKRAPKTGTPSKTPHDELMRQIAVLASRISDIENGLVAVREHASGVDEELRETREICSKWQSFVSAAVTELRAKKAPPSWFSWLRGAGAGR